MEAKNKITAEIDLDIIEDKKKIYICEVIKCAFCIFDICTASDRFRCRLKEKRKEMTIMKDDIRNLLLEK